MLWKFRLSNLNYIVRCYSLLAGEFSSREIFASPTRQLLKLIYSVSTFIATRQRVYSQVVNSLHAAKHESKMGLVKSKRGGKIILFNTPYGKMWMEIVLEYKLDCISFLFDFYRSPSCSGWISAQNETPTSVRQLSVQWNSRAWSDKRNHLHLLIPRRVATKLA
jgi:hypothetical protein